MCSPYNFYLISALLLSCFGIAWLWLLLENPNGFSPNTLAQLQISAERRRRWKNAVPSSLRSTISPSCNITSPETNLARLSYCHDVTVGVSSSGLALLLRRAAMAASLTNQSHRRVVRTGDYGQTLDSEWNFVLLRTIISCIIKCFGICQASLPWIRLERNRYQARLQGHCWTWQGQGQLPSLARLSLQLLRLWHLVDVLYACAYHKTAGIPLMNKLCLRLDMQGLPPLVLNASLDLQGTGTIFVPTREMHSSTVTFLVWCVIVR